MEDYTFDNKPSLRPKFAISLESMKQLRIYYCFVFAGALSMTATTSTVEAFQVSSSPWQRTQGRRCVCFSATANDATGLVVEVSLDKPLGMILEEVEEGTAKGVTVTGLREDGSAISSDFKDQLVGLRLVSVMGKSVTNLMFDDVMGAIIDAPSPVTLELQSVDDNAEMTKEAPEQYPVGTVVSIKVLDERGDETVVEARVGDNLRFVLLQNNIEVYKGLKQKLGNW